MNYSRFLTALSQKRKPSTIREMTNLLVSASPELVFLGGGMPNPALFPFEEATLKLKDGNELKIDSKLMTSALQYGPTQGYPPLVSHLKSMTKRLHSPPLWDETEIAITPGSQDGLCKAIEMLLKPNDYFITQEPVYSGTLAILNPYEPKFLPIECDDKGMIPESLRKALSEWSPEEARSKTEGVPKVMYINPNACNPTGVSLPTDRRKEIYSLAQQYDIIILEDDPYYFVQFDDQKDWPASFLSLDVDGRVLRFDSFSKVLSSGLRVGFVTGPRPLVKNIILHMQASILHTSSFSQVMVSELLTAWGESGFASHIEKLRDFYHQRRDHMLEAASKHLTGVCEWSVPTGGMFLWMKVPALSDTWDMIMLRGISKNVVLVPGRAFQTNSQPNNFLRAAFSLAEPHKMDLGMKYLAELIKEEIELNKDKS